MKPIQYGIIGFGGIALNRIAKEGFRCDSDRFSPAEGVQLKGVTSRTETRRKAAEELGLRWYASAEELLADPEIDAVFIATDNLTHYDYAAQAMEAGKHVILEKPLTPDLEDAEKLKAFAEKKGLSLSVNHMMRYNSYNRKALELIENGKIGSLEPETGGDAVLHFEFSYGAAEEEKRAWRCADPAEKGGPIGDVGSHGLYMAEYLLGKQISRVSCIYLPRTIDIAVENGAFIQFECSDGFLGSIRLAFNQNRGGLAGTVLNCGYEIYGNKGILRGYGTLGQLSGHEDEPVPIRLFLDDGAELNRIALAAPVNEYAAVIDEHAESVRSGKPLDCSEGVRNVRQVLGCYASADTGGKWMEV